MSLPKISVIVPAYNIETYIEATLNSLTNQTYSNLEIIVVDDGSTDNTAKILDNFKIKHNNVIVIHKNNEGVCSARNTGISVATGEYIAFCDGDDLVDNDIYDFLYNNLVNNNADISMCDVRFILPDNTVKNVATNSSKCYDNPTDYLTDFFNNKVRIGVYTKLYKAEICKNTKFNENLKINEDRLFCFETALNANKIYFSSTAKYSYFRREKSSSVCSFSEKFFDIIKVSDCITNEIKNKFPNLLKNAEASQVTFYLRYLKLKCLRGGNKSFLKEEQYVLSFLKKYNLSNAKTFLNKSDYIRLRLLRTSKNLFNIFTKLFDKF